MTSKSFCVITRRVCVAACKLLLISSCVRANKAVTCSVGASFVSKDTGLYTVVTTDPGTGIPVTVSIGIWTGSGSAEGVTESTVVDCSAYASANDNTCGASLGSRCYANKALSIIGFLPGVVSLFSLYCVKSDKECVCTCVCACIFSARTCAACTLLLGHARQN